MTQTATAVIVTEPQWYELNPSLFGLIAVPRLVLSPTLSSRVLTIVQMEAWGKPPAGGADLSAFLLCDCDC